MVFMGSGGGVSLCQTEYYGRIIENSLPINCRGGGGGGEDQVKFIVTQTKTPDTPPHRR